MDAQVFPGPKVRMTERSAPAGNPPLGRWLLVAALILAGIVLYFLYAPATEPPAPPAAREEAV